MKPHRQVFGETLARLGAELQQIVVLDADLSKSTKTSIFAKAFPARFHDMGISEQDMLATAAGLATTGLIPVASTFAIFGTGRAWEQLRNSICYPRLNVKLVATHGGITVGEDGGSHQSVEDIATTRVIPNLQVFVPADAEETAQVIETVIKRIDGPCYVRLPRGAGAAVSPAGYHFEPGRAALLRTGKDICFAACGLMVQTALAAATFLEAEGLSASVLNISSIKPIDVEALTEAARRCGAMVTIEEHSILGGMGSAVCEVLAEHHPIPVKRLGLADCFGQSGDADALLVHYGLTAEKAAEAARTLIAAKG